MAPPASAGRCGPTEETAVRFAYTLIQPWSLGLVCKCDAIFRPVSRVYNTFGLENPLRGPGPRRCAPRACYVRVCTGTVVCDGQPDTYTCVRTLQLQDPPNRLPIGSSAPTPASGTPTPTPNGVPARVRTGTHHPPAVRPRPSLRPFSPTSILTSAFLLSSTPRPFLFLLLFFFFLSLSLSISRSLLLPLLPRCAKHRDMHEHQTALTAEVTHPSTRRCLPMDS